MRRKKGYTLVENLVALFIIAIVIIGSVKFYIESKKSLNNINNKSTMYTNLKISQEFIVNKVRECNEININSGKIYIDGNELYVRGEILRYKTSSQQISPDIIKVSIENIGDDTYKVTIKGRADTVVSIVKRGGFD